MGMPTEEERESALKKIVGSDREDIVRAAKVLESDKSTTSRLVQLLESEARPENRQGILYALSWHADLRTWDLMVRVFSDALENPKVRGQAAEGLAYMFSDIGLDSKEFEAGVKALIGGLDDPSPEVRYCAVHALGTTGHLPLIPVLQGMLADETPVEGWIGTVGGQAGSSLEHLQEVHEFRRKQGV
jgi:HEAT repeat protein